MATPVTVPEVAERWWVALMSTPTENRSGWACSAGADRAQGLGEHHGRAAVQQAVGLGVALDRHRGDDPLRRDLEELDAHPVVEGAHALGHPGEELLDRRRSASRRSCRHSACRRRRLASAGARSHRRPPPPAPARRTLAGLSRVLRAAGGELLDGHRPAHQRGLRVHLDADQRAARRAADPRRGRVRRVPADVPPGGVLRVQGEAQQDPRRVQQPAAADRGGPRRAAHPVPEEARLRGRRHHRHPGHPGGGRRHGRADPDRRPRLPPAGQRAVDGALPDARRVRPGPDDPGGGAGQVRRPAGALPRARRAGGGDLRQPARRARRRCRATPPSGSTSTTASTT